MTDPDRVEKLARKIERIFILDPVNAETQIEQYLKEELDDLPNQEKKTLLGKTAGVFKIPVPGGSDMNEDALAKIFSMLLGRDVCRDELNSEDMLIRLGQSLNTIFDTLNHLVGVIDKTLFGESAGEETIRHFIGSHVEGHDCSGSLESYIGRINKAFLITQEAFKQAAETKVGEILAELDPEQISSKSSGLKFGPLRRAESFAIYEEKYQQLRKWFESGRFKEQLVREFEKKCRSMD
ncbi:MAG: hypothetical protein JRE58_02845 [Deltaproteobacteria bacterium]|nr:hypothetical protein [Deltaproteobacteria bacterium]